MIDLALSKENIIIKKKAGDYASRFSWTKILPKLLSIIK